MNELIFGKDDTSHIVNITVKNDGRALVYREFPDEIICDEYEYSPFILSPYQQEGSERLKGDQYYKWLTPTNPETYYDIRDWTSYKPRSMEEGFMQRSGMTYFKGMKASEVSLCGIDIETINFDPTLEDSLVVLITNTFRRNGVITKKMFDILDYESEGDMLNDWVKWIHEVNPSIFLFHNGFRFDIPFLNHRYKNSFGTSLPLGRDYSEIEFDSNMSKKRKDGSQTYDYFNARITGREIVDSMFMAVTYDVGRDFSAYNLKSLERELNLVDGDRTEWDFNENPVKVSYELAKSGNLSSWNVFRDYCETDGDSPVKMFDIMGPSFFYLNQSVPKKFQQMINEATGSQIDSFMIRAYLQDGYSQPKTSANSNFEGAISMGIPGVYNNMKKVDVASLYPSIMRQYKVYPKKKDPNQYFLKSLEYFTEERLKNKAITAETGEKYYDDLQGAQKIFINSMYGFMGAGYLLYNDPIGANMVTRHGREILRKGVIWATGYDLIKVVHKIVNKGKPNEKKEYKWVLGEKVGEGRGYHLINVDTDSFGVSNGSAPSKSEFANEIKQLNAIYPELIKWEDDGVFEKVIVFGAKNYVLKKHPNWCNPKTDLDENGNVKIKYKGSATTDPKKEPALLEFIKRCVNAILCDQSDNILNIYHEYCFEATHIDDIKRWAVKKTVTKSVLDATTPQQAKILEAIGDRRFEENDKIWIYRKEDPEFPGDITKTKIGLVDDYKGDHYSWHYVKRVYATLSILKNIIDLSHYEKYHNKTKRHLLTEKIDSATI